MFASIRIFYKFEKIFGLVGFLGRLYAHLVELINKSQEFKWFYKNLQVI